jgi:hypothetical protein
MDYDMTTPCEHCPFRNDKPGFITPARAREIAHAIIQEQRTFTCHKTTVPVEDDDGGSDMVDGPNAQHCGGALIFLESIERPNQMMRIAERLGLYDRRKLDMTAPVVRSAAEFVRLQSSTRDLRKALRRRKGMR